MKKLIVGIYDFSKQPYALGDIILFLQNIKCLQMLKNINKIRIIIKINSDNPSNLNQQKIINNSNFKTFLFKICRTFCLIDTNEIYFINDSKVFNYQIFRNYFEGNYIYPGVYDYFTDNIDISTHRIVNKTFNQKKKIPLFNTSIIMKNKLNKIKKKKISITVSIRNQKKTNQVDTKRDAKYENWIEFFKISKHKFPNIIFLILGDYDEFDYQLLKIPNVYLTRFRGHDLFDDLGFILSSDFFIGSSSGFANLAIFSNVNYSIMSVKKEHESDGLIKYGSRKYIFANDRQNLIWSDESTNTLIKQIEHLK